MHGDHFSEARIKLSATATGSIHVAKLRLVKRIDEVSAELQANLFPKIEVLRRTDVPLVIARKPQRRDWRRAVRPRRRKDKRAGVKPEQAGLIAGSGIAHLIGSTSDADSKPCSRT